MMQNVLTQLDAKYPDSMIQNVLTQLDAKYPDTA